MRKKVVFFLLCTRLFFSLVAVWGGGGDERRILGLFRHGSIALFADKGLVDVRNDATTGNGRLDEGVQLFVSSDGKLQVTGSNTLHLQILGSVACQLKNLSCQVLEDGGGVDGSSGADTSVGSGPVLQVPVDTTHRELETSTGRP